MVSCHFCNKPIRGHAGEDWFYYEVFRPFKLDLYPKDVVEMSFNNRKYVCGPCKNSVLKDKRTDDDVYSEILNSEFRDPLC